MNLKARIKALENHDGKGDGTRILLTRTTHPDYPDEFEASLNGVSRAVSREEFEELRERPDAFVIHRRIVTHEMVSEAGGVLGE